MASSCPENPKLLWALGLLLLAAASNLSFSVWRLNRVGESVPPAWNRRFFSFAKSEEKVIQIRDSPDDGRVDPAVGRSSEYGIAGAFVLFIRTVVPAPEHAEGVVDEIVKSFPHLTNVHGPIYFGHVYHICKTLGEC